MSKALASAAAIALTFVAYLPYLRSIQRGAAKPHVFSWVIWGFTIFVVFFAQVTGRGGVGAWPTAVTGLLTIYIAWLASKRRAEVRITRADWIFLVAAVSALPCWFFTSDPLWAVVTLTGVDAAAFGPTIARGYVRPRSESAMFFGTFVLRNLLIIMALEHYSLTTILFPAVDALACLLLVATLLCRRQVLTSRGGQGGDSSDHIPPAQAVNRPGEAS